MHETSNNEDPSLFATNPKIRQHLTVSSSDLELSLYRFKGDRNCLLSPINLYLSSIGFQSDYQRIQLFCSSHCHNLDDWFSPNKVNSSFTDINQSICQPSRNCVFVICNLVVLSSLPCDAVFVSFVALYQHVLLNH